MFERRIEFKTTMEVRKQELAVCIPDDDGDDDDGGAGGDEDGDDVDDGDDEDDDDVYDLMHMHVRQ